jgi:acyl-CoA thioesterase-1
MRNLLTLLMLFAAAATQAAIAPTVLVFGDSLSAGYGIDVDQSWPALLQVRLESQGYEHRVINASISGETTEGGATRIASTLENFSPDLVILELGGNDGDYVIPMRSKTYIGNWQNSRVFSGLNFSWRASR